MLFIQNSFYMFSGIPPFPEGFFSVSNLILFLLKPYFH